MQFLIRLIKNRLFQHILFWVTAYLVFFAIVRFRSPVNFTWRFSVGVVVPLLIPVYIHFVLLKQLLEKGRYLIYVLLLLITIAGSEFFAQFFISFIFQEEFQTFLSLPSIITAIILTTSIRYMKKSYLDSIRFKNMEKEKTEAELKLLRSQVNPHFLFNTLNNQYSLALSGSDLIAPSILKLSELLRYGIESSDKEFVDLHEEIKFIRNYIDLESMRLDLEKEITINIEGDQEGVKIAPLLISPLVENAFVHGTDSYTEKFVLKISIIISEGKVHISVFNTCPSENRSLNSTSGTGLRNLRARLGLIYPDRYSLNLSEGSGTYTAELILKT